MAINAPRLQSPFNLNASCTLESPQFRIWGIKVLKSIPLYGNWALGLRSGLLSTLEPRDPLKSRMLNFQIPYGGNQALFPDDMLPRECHLGLAQLAISVFPACLSANLPLVAMAAILFAPLSPTNREPPITTCISSANVNMPPLRSHNSSNA
ncbi:hypothetical protein AMTR_s00024p00057560 [Amborella trichopoda]|uniref:Uncharacterized protein n=1 Tax=Amborella trichopoda TaxID=13333 RepID=W1PSK1_AMBTC|nr:hypothetical protein AMTR_s00024p00057560 [Amborella trichopoda]